ncbi:oligodendrocyte-myelin glycoprotein [Gadus morhua]|uniref:LRRNT domain-containing protein n=1 Tax=Gadus morhua TaxID=8049 RepID=A0A8C5FMM1_GADMO|nr:oligodendrocyte-myelin glycoprotein [Gadus morhua]
MSSVPHRSSALPRLLPHLLLLLLLLGEERVRAVCPSVCSCNPDHREVDCSGKGLRRLPHGLQPNLHSLNLSHNRLHHLDGQLGGYAHLRALDLSHNRLAQLPADLPRSLWQLRASSNRLRLLDKNDTAYQWNLRLLDLSDNRLERAVFINNTLPALRLLNLSRNHFWTVPTNMPSPLETVDLSHNSLVQVLPGSLDRLPRLSRLYLHGNRFAALPDGALDRLAALRLLTLGENPWACHLPVNMSYLLLWMQYTPARVLGCPCSGRFVCGRPPPEGADGANNNGAAGGGGVWNHGTHDLPSLAANAQDLGFMGPGSDPTGTWWHRTEPAPGGGGRRERWDEAEERRRQEADLHLTSGESAGPSATQHRHTLFTGRGPPPDDDTDPALTWKWNTAQSSGVTPPPGLGGDPRATLPDGTLLAAGGVAVGTKKTTTVRTRSVRRPNQSVPSSSGAPSAPGRPGWLWPAPHGLGLLVLQLLRVL